jgi:LemA protein
MQLQQELSDTEDKVAYSRQYYNTSVMEFNTRLQVFPNSMVASGFGFTPKEFFGATDDERKAVKVSFD